MPLMVGRRPCRGCGGGPGIGRAQLATSGPIAGVAGTDVKAPLGDGAGAGARGNVAGGVAPGLEE